MALGGFFVLLERHHVHRAHGIQPGAHVAVDLVFDGELFIANDGNGDVCHQFVTLDSEFVQAGFGHVLPVRL